MNSDRTAESSEKHSRTTLNCLLLHYYCLATLQVDGSVMVQARLLFDTTRTLERWQQERDADVDTRLEAVEMHTDGLVDSTSILEGSLQNRSAQLQNDLLRAIQIIAGRQNYLLTYVGNETEKIDGSLRETASSLLHNITDGQKALEEHMFDGLQDMSNYLLDMARGMKSTAEFTNAMRQDVSKTGVFLRRQFIRILL